MAELYSAESKIKDINLWELGRMELELAEVEMPGLMACRKEFGDAQPLKGARLSGSLHMTIQTACLIETLQKLGADIRWCSCNIFSTQEQAAAAIVKANSSKVFAWKGESLREYWECTMNALIWPNGLGPNILVDDGGDASMMILQGQKWEEAFEKDGTLPDPSKVETEDERELLQILKETIPVYPNRWRTVLKDFYGCSEETTTGVHRLYQLADKKELPFPAINVNDSVTKSKFDNVYGCRHSLTDGIFRATDVMIAGKKAVVCGYGDVGKGCVQALKGAGARVFVTEVDPICALQACMEGIEVVKLETVLAKGDLFITTTGNKNIIMAHHMSQMKNNAIVGNIGHFDNEIDLAGLNKWEGCTKKVIKENVVSRYEFADGHGILLLAEGRLLNLGCATGHPSWVMSCSFTNQTLAQLELWNNRNGDKYQPQTVYKLPKELDEKVARLHLPSLGAELTTLSPEQADYIGVAVDGPFKNEEYRY